MTKKLVSFDDVTNRLPAAVESLLNATLARVSQARPGNAAVFLGDSITAGSIDETNHAYGASWPTFACGFSGQRIQYVYNAGVPGNNSGQMLDRIQADVIARAPQLCTLMAGTNDIGNNVPFATYQANVRAIVTALRTAGIVPVICTIPPNADAARHGRISQWNGWLKRYAASLGLILLDTHGVLVDPATAGAYLAAYNGDGTHPNMAGTLAVGQYVATNLAPLLPTFTPLLTDMQADPSNLLTGGLFAVDSNADGYADGWVQYGGAVPGATPSLVTDAAVKGKMQRVTQVATTSNSYVSQSIAPPKYTSGDRLLLTAVVTSDGGVSAQITVNSYGGTDKVFKPLSDVTAVLTRVLVYQEFTPPTGSVDLDIVLTAGPGTGVVDWGQIGVFNLTALGIATP